MHEEAIEIIQDNSLEDENKIESLQDLGYDLEDIFDLIFETVRRQRPEST